MAESSAFGDSLDVKITSHVGWDALVSLLRKVPLRGDHSRLPYASANIATKQADISDLAPTALYVLQSQLDFHAHLRHSLLSQNVPDVFDLAGMLHYELADRPFTIIPPIVEIQADDDDPTKRVPIIVDGLHRIWLARQLGMQQIAVIEISGISPAYPFFGKPVAWNEVKVREMVPSTSEKRRYRFDSYEDCMQLADQSLKAFITPDNFRYFYYRDLSGFGSSGIRS